MKVFIDTNNGYKCYASNVTSSLLEVDEEFFDGKCAEVVEGYICKPVGYALDGKYADVKMIYPWKNYARLYEAQAEYEHQLLLEYETALTEIEIALGVTSE